METRYSFFIHTTPKLPYLIPEQPKPDQSHQLVVVSARVLPSEAILQRPRGLRGSAVIGAPSDDDQPAQPPALHHRRVYPPRSPKTHSGGFSDEVVGGRGGLEGAEGVGGSVGKEMAMVWLGSEGGGAESSQGAEGAKGTESLEGAEGAVGAEGLGGCGGYSHTTL